jgi:hypothetical protein
MVKLRPPREVCIRWRSCDARGGFAFHFVIHETTFWLSQKMCRCPGGASRTAFKTAHSSFIAIVAGRMKDGKRPWCILLSFPSYHTTPQPSSHASEKISRLSIVSESGKVDGVLVINLSHIMRISLLTAKPGSTKSPQFLAPDMMSRLDFCIHQMVCLRM